MSQQHPITPPPKLVEEWANASARTHRENGTYAKHEFTLATQAARWGADQELEACCEWLDKDWHPDHSKTLRATRRPKPPSLKEQALAAFEHILNQSSTELGAETVRRALEQLDD